MATNEDAAATGGDSDAPQPVPFRTVVQARDQLARIRLKGDASLAAWLSYYQQSAEVFRKLADIDRRHPCVALYWAQLERRKIVKIVAEIIIGASPYDLRSDSAAGRG